VISSGTRKQDAGCHGGQHYKLLKCRGLAKHSGQKFSGVGCYLTYVFCNLLFPNFKFIIGQFVSNTYIQDSTAVEFPIGLGQAQAFTK
jgi:hypothetical protein